MNSSLLSDVASALSYAHSRDMIHRDIKPSNVLINHDNQVILSDFGIAKKLSNTEYTATGAMTGTPPYISPEQGLGEPGDARSELDHNLPSSIERIITKTMAKKPVDRFQTAEEFLRTLDQVRTGFIAPDDKENSYTTAFNGRAGLFAVVHPGR